MNILKAVLEHEVFPALGCTEPIAVAYAAGLAGDQLGADFEEMTIAVDPGVYKNGLAVHVPNTDGERGNLIAGVLGALIRRPDLKMEILKAVQSEQIPRARSLIESGKARIRCRRRATGMHIDVKVRRGSETARAVIRHRHTNLVLLEKNGRSVFQGDIEKDRQVLSDYQTTLSRLRIIDLIRAAEKIDDDYPMYLTTGRLLYQYHTGTMTMKTDGLNEIAPECFVEISSQDARKYEMQDGAAVTIDSRRGSIQAKIRISDKAVAGTIFIPFHYGVAAANRLTNAALDPICGIPEYKVCAVKLSKTSSDEGQLNENQHQTLRPALKKAGLNIVIFLI